MRPLTANAPASVTTTGRGKSAPAGRAMTRPPLRKKPRSRFERFMLRGGAACGVVLVLGGFGLWGVHSGWLGQASSGIGDIMLTATARAGMALDEVHVTGRSETSQ